MLSLFCRDENPLNPGSEMGKKQVSEPFKWRRCQTAERDEKNIFGCGHSSMNLNWKLKLRGRKTFLSLFSKPKTHKDPFHAPSLYSTQERRNLKSNFVSLSYHQLKYFFRLKFAQTSQVLQTRRAYVSKTCGVGAGFLSGRKFPQKKENFFHLPRPFLFAAKPTGHIMVHGVLVVGAVTTLNTHTKFF